MRHIILALFFVSLLPSCLSVGVDKVDTEPGFDWETMKRDQILMTPLIDLRTGVVSVPGQESLVAPFSSEQNIAYAEAFKQVFFKWRKDIRVFGAGGAFENISTLPNLPELSRKALNKESFSPEDVAKIRDLNQGIRFLFFFNLVGERLEYRYSVAAPSDAKGLYIEKNYEAVHILEVELALWDSKEAKTVLKLQKIVQPTSFNQVILRTGKIPDKTTGKSPGRYASAVNPDIWDMQGTNDLEHELKVHKLRFPKFLGREPSFSASFKDVALSMPIQGSEQNLIEYKNFTNHRPELTFRSQKLGSLSSHSLFFGASSIIYNRYRFGAGLDFSISDPQITYQQKKYKLQSANLLLTTDMEWQLSPGLRMLTGALLGGGSFTIKSTDTPTVEAQDSAGQNNKPADPTDSYSYVAPRVRFLLGSKQGGQIGLGVYKQFYKGLDRPEVLEHMPSKWGVEATLAVTFRGF